MIKVLIIHGLRFDSRLTTFQHTLSFARHLVGCEVTYVNGQGLIDDEILSLKFDLAIVTYELVALRNTPFWTFIERRIGPLLRASKTRVVMPQDDYSSCAVLDNFIVRNSAICFLSFNKRSESALSQFDIERCAVLNEALTGYWEVSTVLPYTGFRQPFSNGSVDLGQRVRHLPPQLGRAAQKKGELAIAFAAAAEIEGFTCDVSTKDSDVLIGFDWWRFLGNTKFTVGRLGGASIADPNGNLAMKVHQIQLRKPGISYEEISRKLDTTCSPHGDFSAISPRIFECAAMGVCQILERDRYFDDFEPWVHYIPLEPNMSNLHEVFDAMRDETLCSQIISRAEEALILSGKYSYRTFVRQLISTCTGIDLPEVADIKLKDNDSALMGNYHFDDIERHKDDARQAIIRQKFRRSRTHSNEADKWVSGFESGSLILESLTLPWCAALPSLDRS